MARSESSHGATTATQANDCVMFMGLTYNGTFWHGKPSVILTHSRTVLATSHALSLCLVGRLIPGDEHEADSLIVAMRDADLQAVLASAAEQGLVGIDILYVYRGREMLLSFQPWKGDEVGSKVQRR